MKKRNAFCVFMDEHRKQKEDEGHVFPRGRADLATLMSAEWEALSQAEKDKYAERAKRSNERERERAASASLQFPRVDYPGAPAAPAAQFPRVDYPVAPAPPAAQFPHVDFPGVPAPPAQFPHVDYPGAAAIPPPSAEFIRQTANVLTSAINFNKVPVTPMQLACLENRHFVARMFDDPSWDWKAQPIVICSFTLYFDPEYDDLFLPAEIGLSAFNIKDGVFDNYARIIAPENIPLGRGTDIVKTVEALGIPYPPNEPEFCEYAPLMMILRDFLEKHRGKFPADEFCVFAFDCDFELITRCIQWLNENSASDMLRIRVLSLTLFAHLASTNENPTLRKVFAVPSDTDPDEVRHRPCPFDSVDTSSVLASVSTNRTYGEALNNCFIYPSENPMTLFGIYLCEGEIDDLITTSDNYKYYDELCCIYHYKGGDGIHHCALNISNRYAYNLLEVLTISNEVKLNITGGHCPEVNNRIAEKNRRQSWLKRWAITKVEEEMPDPPETNLTSVPIQSQFSSDSSNRGRNKRPWNHGSSNQSFRDYQLNQEAEETEDVPVVKVQQTRKRNQYGLSDYDNYPGTLQREQQRREQEQRRNPYSGSAPEVYYMENLEKK